MARTIDAALFDFGGVFTESPFDVLEAMAADLGADPALLTEVVFGPYDQDTDHPWHRVERGELALEVARDEIVALGARAGVEADPFQVFARMARTNRAARAEVVACVVRARDAGVRTALVTNNAREFRTGWRRMIDVELFDAVVDSSEVGVRKPDPRIYHLALEQVGAVAPERAAFLDDFAGNVAAAERIGLRGILVGPDPAPALSALDALLAGSG